MALSSCETVGGCPPLVTYSKEFQAEAQKEFQKLPQGSRLETLIADYSKMRDACRVKL